VEKISAVLQKNNKRPRGNPNVDKYHWKPGQSGNPSGRPKGSQSYNEIIRSLGSKKIKDCQFIPEEIKSQFLTSDENLTIKEALVQSATIRALSGDKHALDFVADREEGKAPETIKITDERVVIDIDEDEDDEEYNKDDTDIDNPDRGGDCDGTV